jgi:hypothetical protein
VNELQNETLPSIADRPACRKRRPAADAGSHDPAQPADHPIERRSQAALSSLTPGSNLSSPRLPSAVPGPQSAPSAPPHCSARYLLPC